MNFNSDKVFETVNGLIERVIPNYKGKIKLELISSEDGKDVFEVDSLQGKVLLRGNNAVSLSTALNWYLKYYANVHISWCGSQVNLPTKLVLPTEKYRHVIEEKYRVYLNYCTINYSASWWNFDRWEKEIDFMALNGINMPLAVVGIEGVWYKTLLKFNFSDKEAREFLVGPAYLAWQWMTNIENHCGPLPLSWIEKRIKLGKKIINRMVEYGMYPIQQGFTGYVPRALKEKYPEANIIQSEKWCSFTGVDQLDPLDPLFDNFGRVFLEVQKEVFGSHHFYAADPFHEGQPPVKGKEYLNKVGAAIRDLMLDFDEDAKWIMQAWSIREDIVKAIPKDMLIVLDLNGETYKSKDNFWGYDFIVGNLHNFGGRINMHGDLPLLASNMYKKAKAVVPNAIGTGLFMESIGQNPLYYDLAFEMNIREDEVNLHKWLKKYAERRYGASSEKATKAVYTLLETAYKEGTNGVEKSSIICARPAVHAKKSGPNHGFIVPYDNKELFQALILLLEDEDKLKNSEGYKYDLVDILRQVLSNYGQELHRKIEQAFKAKDIQRFIECRNNFLQLLKDVNELLSTRIEFSFEKWIKDARLLGDTEEEKNLYELNASMLVTMWGPEEEPSIFDYAWKEWSGLIEQYYYMRWEKFYKMLEEKLEKGEEYIEEGLPLVYDRETFRANEFYSKLADEELKWIKSVKNFKKEEKKEELTIVKKLVKKYKGKILCK